MTQASEAYDAVLEQEEDDMIQANWDQEMADSEDYMNENGFPNGASGSENEMTYEQVEENLVDAHEYPPRNEF